MPFAEIVPAGKVREELTAIKHGLADLAFSHWQVMKLCVGLLCGAEEYCFLDDDMFIVDRLKDALEAFKTHDLVYAPDADYSHEYAGIWDAAGQKRQIPTGNINTGLYWLRNKHQREKIAARLLSVPAGSAPSWQWEQGFMAHEYLDDVVCALPGQRYFYPYFDGLPGGPTGYDFAGNPCGFASVHYGGLAQKPSDAAARMLAAQLLNRRYRRGA
jgi:hypothetical protein